jgi:hypothetical protein
MTDQQSTTEQHNSELKIIIEVNAQAEAFYPDTVELGDHAAYALQKDHRSQLTGLENIADGALKTTDVFDYVKRQTARFEYWRKDFPTHSEQSFGLRLLDYLEKKLPNKRDAICNKLKIGDATDDDKYLRRRIYLLLIRQCVHQLVIEYEFRVNADLQQQHNSRRA